MVNNSSFVLGNKSCKETTKLFLKRMEIKITFFSGYRNFSIRSFMSSGKSDEKNKSFFNIG